MTIIGIKLVNWASKLSKFVNAVHNAFSTRLGEPNWFIGIGFGFGAGVVVGVVIDFVVEFVDFVVDFVVVAFVVVGVVAFVVVAHCLKNYFE